MARRPKWCPIPHVAGRGGDHVIGEAHYPGSRAYGHLEGNVVHYIPVLANQKICTGDIVTQVRGHAARVTSAAEAGDGMNWGDVSGGAYMALGPADTSGRPDGSEDVPVYTHGAKVESILDAGIAPGSLVGVDLRDGAGGSRADRGAPVDMSTPREPDRSLWQRVRAMSPGDASDPTRGRALLGTMVKILTLDDPRRTVSRVGDYGAVVIGARR